MAHDVGAEIEIHCYANECHWRCITNGQLIEYWLDRAMCVFLKTKCHQYWPELGHSITYGSYHVTCVDVVSSGDYEKRFLQLSRVSLIKHLSDTVANWPSLVQVKTHHREDPSPASNVVPIDDGLSLSTINSMSDDDPSRLIIQYHYTQWKDMDVPTDSHTLLHLIREVNEQTDAEQYPIVVHCTWVLVPPRVSCRICSFQSWSWPNGHLHRHRCDDRQDRARGENWHLWFCITNASRT